MPGNVIIQIGDTPLKLPYDLYHHDDTLDKCMLRICRQA